MRVVFDVGGSHLRVGVSADGKTLLQASDSVTPAEPEAAVAMLAEMAGRMGNGEKIDGAAGGIAGVWDESKRKLLGSPNLLTWVDYPVAEKLEAALGAKVLLENDAALGGLGEAVFGAGRGKKIVAYLAVGTGVGGARIVDGKIDTNYLGFEPGHQYIRIQNSEIRNQNEGGETLEELVGGRSLEKRHGKRAEEITDPKVWEEVADNLAAGIVNLILLWTPNIVVLGGSVVRSVPWEKMVEGVSARLKVYPWVPQMVRRSLGEKAGLYGGLALLN